MLVNLRQSRSVSAVVDAWTRGGGGGGGGGGADGEDKVNGRDGIGETDALRLGARAHALRRARRDGDDRDALRRDALDLAAAFAENDELDDDDEEKRATRVGFARCAAGLKTRADAAWLHAHVPKDIDVAAFVADDAASGNGYRARAIVAFARARGDLVETALAFSSRYGGDGDAVAVAVAVAAAAGTLSDATGGVVRGDEDSKARDAIVGAFGKNPERAIEGLKTHAWEALPSSGAAFGGYFDFLSAALAAAGDKDAAATAAAAAAAARALHGATSNFPLGSFFDESARVPAGTTASVATTAVATAIATEAVRDGRLRFPGQAVNDLARAVTLLPPSHSALGMTSHRVYLAAAVATLECESSTPEQRWAAVGEALPSLAPADLFAVVAFAALDGSHPLARDGCEPPRPESSSSFNASAAVELKIAAITAGVKLLESVGGERAGALKTSLARFSLAAAAADATPSTTDVAALDRAARSPSTPYDPSLRDIACAWVASGGVSLRYVAAFADLASEIEGHGGGGVDVASVVAAALDRALRALSSTETVADETAAADTLRNIFLGTLRDAPARHGEVKATRLSREGYAKALASIRGAAFETLERFAGGDASRYARDVALDLLGEVSAFESEKALAAKKAAAAKAEAKARGGGGGGGEAEAETEAKAEAEAEAAAAAAEEEEAERKAEAARPRRRRKAEAEAGRESESESRGRSRRESREGESESGR